MSVSDAFAGGALVVSIAAAGIAAWHSRRELGHGREALQVTTYQGATELALNFDRMLIDYPFLRPYFYESEPVPAEDDGSAPAEADRHRRQRVLAAAEFALDIFECIWDHRDSYNSVDHKAWRRWILDVMESSPACCEIYAEANADPTDPWYPSLARIVAIDGRPPGADAA